MLHGWLSMSLTVVLKLGIHCRNRVYSLSSVCIQCILNVVYVRLSIPFDKNSKQVSERSLFI